MNLTLRQHIGLWLLGKAGKLQPGRRKADASIGAMGMAIETGNVPGSYTWSKWDRKKAIEDGYKASVWVYRCINRKSSQAASIPWIVQQKVQDGWEEVEEHDVINLMQQPNPLYTWADMIEGIITYLELTGESYIGINRAGSSRELWIIPSHLCAPTASPTNIIDHFEYTNGSKIVKLDPNDVIYIRYPDPSNPLRGLAPLMSAARTVDTDVSATDWNRHAMENRTVPDLVMHTEVPMEEEQFTTFQELLKEEYQSAHNARRPMLLGNFKVDKMGYNAVEMDFVESRKMTRIEICAAFDVPPQLVGIPDASTYANYETAQKAFWQDTVIPLVRKLRDILNNALGREYQFNPRKLRINYDLSDVPALNESVNEHHDRIRKDFLAGLISHMEAREEMSYESNGIGDFWFMPNTNVATPDPSVDPEQDPYDVDPNGEDEDDDDSQEKDVDQGENEDDDPQKKSRKSQPRRRKKGAFNLKTEEQKADHWKAMDSRRDSYYKAVKGKYEQFFKVQKDAVKRAVIKGEGNFDVVHAILEKHKSDMTKLVKAVFTAVIKDFGSSTFSELKQQARKMERKDDSQPVFDDWSPYVQDWIQQNAATEVSQITDTTQSQLRDLLAQGIDGGLSISDIAKSIDTLYLENIIPNRSTVIARTEVIRASNFGSRAGALQTGLTLKKEWIATRDGRTRDDHLNADGQTTGMDDPFEIGGFKLLYPGDISNGAPARETIQCRCTEAYQVV